MLKFSWDSCVARHVRTFFVREFKVIRVFKVVKVFKEGGDVP